MGEVGCPFTRYVAGVPAAMVSSKSTAPSLSWTFTAPSFVLRTDKR
jgi:hypothetical protein